MRETGAGRTPGDAGPTWDALKRLAYAAMELAHAPFSRYRVGAALEADHGTVYTGCNVESASFGLTTCAERVALLKAVSEGARHFRRLAVVAEGAPPPVPCGACRQLLWEWAPDLEVWVQGDPSPRPIAQLLPWGFRLDPPVGPSRTAGPRCGGMGPPCS